MLINHALAACASSWKPLVAHMAPTLRPGGGQPDWTSRLGHRERKLPPAPSRAHACHCHTSMSLSTEAPRSPSSLSFPKPGVSLGWPGSTLRSPSDPRGVAVGSAVTKGLPSPAHTRRAPEHELPGGNRKSGGWGLRALRLSYGSGKRAGPHGRPSVAAPKGSSSSCPHFCE